MIDNKDHNTHLVVLWCTECKRPIGITLIGLGETFKDGVHYWFGKEISVGTPVNNDGFYTCPNCEKGIVLFWCPMDGSEIPKLNYDPYLKTTDHASKEHTKQFRDWIVQDL